MEEVSLYPKWREAVKSFVQSNPQPGDILTEEWRCEQFGLTKPSSGKYEEFQRYQFDMLNAMQGFSKELLENHMIHLKSIGGGKYLVLAPKEQTSEAWRSGVNDIGRAMSKMANALTHVDHSLLSGEERKENTDAVAKLSFMASMVKRARRLKLPTVSELETA